MNTRLLKFNEVSQKVGLSRRSIYQKIKDNTFPRQRKIGYASRWLESEIDEWINALTSS